MSKTKRANTLTISKTISMPLDLLNNVADESEMTGKNISDTVVMLLRISLSMRRDQRQREQETQDKIMRETQGRL
jgi:hypothetical protein